MAAALWWAIWTPMTGLCRLIAHEGGFMVMAVDYRLAPENKWPAPLDDALAATRWIFDNAPSLGIDAGRIAMGGDSAGGMLAAVRHPGDARSKAGSRSPSSCCCFPAPNSPPTPAR